MTVWFLRGLRRKVVTSRYPFRPEPTVEALPTPPRLRSALLTPQRAAALIDVCPSGAFGVSGATLVYDVGACTACGRCVTAFPELLVPSGIVELGATARDQLIKHVPIAAAGRSR